MPDYDGRHAPRDTLSRELMKTDATALRENIVAAPAQRLMLMLDDARCRARRVVERLNR